MNGLISYFESTGGEWGGIRGVTRQEKSPLPNTTTFFKIPPVSSVRQHSQPRHLNIRQKYLWGNWLHLKQNTTHKIIALVASIDVQTSSESNLHNLFLEFHSCRLPLVHSSAPRGHLGKGTFWQAVLDLAMIS